MGVGVVAVWWGIGVGGTGGQSWNLHYMSCLLNIHKEMFYGASAELLEGLVLKGAHRRLYCTCAGVSPSHAFS